MVIDKVDKPEPPPSYRIQGTVEARGQKHQQQQEEKREEDEYSESHAKGWQKYHTEAKNRRALKLRTQDISKIIFNRAILQKGIVILDTDVKLVNGQIFRNANMFSTKIDIYWRLKKIKQGTELPVHNMIKEDYIEISVLHHDGTVTTEHGEAEAKAQVIQKGAEKSNLWELNWKSIGVIALILIAIVIALIIII